MSEFPSCSFAGADRAERRVRRGRPAGRPDRFCRHPEIGAGGVKTLEQCIACPMAGLTVAPPPVPPGVGTIFAELLKSRYGASATEDCQCQTRANEMDMLGPAWCLANTATVISWVLPHVPKRYRLIPVWLIAWKLSRLIQRAARDADRLRREWNVKVQRLLKNTARSEK